MYIVTYLGTNSVIMDELFTLYKRWNEVLYEITAFGIYSVKCLKGCSEEEFDKLTNPKSMIEGN